MRVEAGPSDRAGAPAPLAGISIRYGVVCRGAINPRLNRLLLS
jgi:hypothetical protein